LHLNIQPIFSLEPEGLKRAFCIVFSVIFSLILLSCGSSPPSSAQHQASGITTRVFVSNPLHQVITTTGARATVPSLDIVNASTDVLSGFTVDVSGTDRSPWFMALSPNKRITVLYNPSMSSIAAVDNTTETTGSFTAITLPDFTQSVAVAPDSNTVFAAVPNASVIGQAPGDVVVASVSGASVISKVAVPGARRISLSHSGNRVLTFSDDADTVTVLLTSLIGTSADPRTTICCFDHPVWGVFSTDDNTAYVLNCGAECGGTVASVSVVDMNASTITATVPVSAATMALLDGNNLYVVGTPPGTACGGGTAAASCGTFNVIDTGSLTVTNPTPVLISDGYHSRLELGANGKLFAGATNCTNINVAGGEVRGCLSIVDSTKLAATVPPENGDVTGLQAIPFRNVVYVGQNSGLFIYDTTTDALQSTQIHIVGNVVDVKYVD
jgi:hypothetical protein